MTQAFSRRPRRLEVIPRKPSIGIDDYLPKEVDKFGGWSTKEPHTIVKISQGKIKDKKHPIIVVSARKGTTDDLIRLADACFEEVIHILEDRLKAKGSIRIDTDLRPFEREPNPYTPSAAVLEQGIRISGIYSNLAEIVKTGFSFKVEGLFGFLKGQELAGLRSQIFNYLVDFDRYVREYFYKRSREVAQRLGLDMNSAHNYRAKSERLNKETSTVMMEEAKQYMRNKFVFWGEYPMSWIITSALRDEGFRVFNAEPSDLGILTKLLAQELEFVDDHQQRIKRRFRELAKKGYDAYVVGGYLAKGIEKREKIFGEEEILMLRTTLGRGGSDLTAVVFGGALGVPVLLYSNTDGVNVCDPRIFPNNRVIPMLSTEEGIEFAKYDCTLLYVRAMEYAFEHNVDVTSLNTFNPTYPGTRIVKNPDSADWLRRTITGISFLDKGDFYTMAVIGSNIGNSYKDVQRATDKLRGIHTIVNQRINTHSVTFDLPKAFVQDKANAERIYNAFCL